MTSLQNAYWTLQESKRHNAEMEKINREQAEAASSQARTKEREVSIAEEKLPYEKRESKSRSMKNTGELMFGIFDWMNQINPVNQFWNQQEQRSKIWKNTGGFQLFGFGKK